MKDSPKLPHTRIPKRYKRNHQDKTLRELIKIKKLREATDNDDKEYGQTGLTLREALQTIEKWIKETGIKCTVRIGDGIITIRFCDPPY